MELLKRRNFSSGAPFEEKVGYSRAVSVGNNVFIGGTTSTNAQGIVEGKGDAYEQTKIILKKIEHALEQAGASPGDVVRVRFYVTDISKGQEYLKAYAEWFKDVKPVITMAEVKALARPEHLVEIEADAIMGSYTIKQPAPNNKKAPEPAGDKNQKTQNAGQTSTFIAVVSAGRDTAGTVGNIAARSPYFLLFDNRGELIEVLVNSHKDIGGGAGPLVAALMAEKGVKTVIAGNFGINIKASFEEKGVGYLAFSGTVGEAVKSIVGRQ